MSSTEIPLHIIHAKCVRQTTLELEASAFQPGISRLIVLNNSLFNEEVPRDVSRFHALAVCEVVHFDHALGLDLACKLVEYIAKLGRFFQNILPNYWSRVV